MEIIENTKEIHEGIKSAIKKYITEEKKRGIHLSMLYIPLKSYFYLKYPDEELTDNEVYYFIVGRGYHAMLDAIMKHFTSDNFKLIGTEIEFNHKNLFYYTPDVLLYFSGIYCPLEIKTTRLSDITKDSIPDSYIFQLKGYISLLNYRSHGKVGFGYLYIVSLIRNETHLYRIEMNKSEMENMVIELENRAVDLMKAVAEGNPQILLRYGLIPAWASKELIKTYSKYGVERYISKTG